VDAPSRRGLKPPRRTETALRASCGHSTRLTLALAAFVGSPLRLGVSHRPGGRCSPFVTATTEPGAIVRTDGWKGYNGLAELGYDHAPLSQGPNPVGDPPYLPRAHRAISNLKAWLHGTHRRASRQHLQPN